MTLFSDGIAGFIQARCKVSGLDVISIEFQGLNYALKKMGARKGHHVSLTDELFYQTLRYAENKAQKLEKARKKVAK